MKLSGICRIVFLLATVVLAGCGSTIGDKCSQNIDCGTARLCDNTMPDGYCTVRGCKFGSCPDDAVCVRFYTTELYCMRSCGETSDCRDGYSCQKLDGAVAKICLPE